MKIGGRMGVSVQKKLPFQQVSQPLLKTKHNLNAGITCNNSQSQIYSANIPNVWRHSTVLILK